MDMKINNQMIDRDLGIASQAEFRLPNVQEAPSAKGTGFLDMLQESLEEVNKTQVASDNSLKDLLAGRNKNIHETMLAMKNAELSLHNMMQVRNKVLEAYKEIMKMQV